MFVTATGDIGPWLGRGDTSAEDDDSNDDCCEEHSFHNFYPAVGDP